MIENERRQRANRNMLSATHAQVPHGSTAPMKASSGGTVGAGAAVGGAVGGPGGVLAGGEVDPSKEASGDPAPTGHADAGRYESTQPFRSRKGDRFS